MRWYLVVLLGTTAAFVVLLTRNLVATVKYELRLDGEIHRADIRDAERGLPTAWRSYSALDNACPFWKRVMMFWRKVDSFLDEEALLAPREPVQHYAGRQYWGEKK